LRAEPGREAALAATPAGTAGRLAGPDHLLRAAYSLIANTAITAALGMGFWIAAARLFPRVTVGRDTVLISVMIELSTICQLNMANGIVRFLPNFGGRSARALAAVYAVTLASAGVIGTGFVLGAPHVSRELRFLEQRPGLAVIFVLSLALWGIFSLQDAALVATRRAPWIPLENGVFGLLKIVALPLLLLAGAIDGVFLAWALPMLVLLIPVNVFIFRRAIPGHAAQARSAAASGQIGAASGQIGTTRAVRFLAQDYAASIFTQATLTALPLLVIARFGARQSAYFAMPFAIAVAFDTFAYGACNALVVEAGRSPQQLPALARRFVARVLIWLLPATAVLAVGAPLVMLPFGSDYANHGAGTLRLLVSASLLRVVIALYAAMLRVRARGLRLAAIELALLVLTLGSALMLSRSSGIDGVAAMWLGANAVVCAAVVPSLIRLLRGGG
jgi:O-antigen/teichoic acid export membrane protein